MDQTVCTAVYTATFAFLITYLEWKCCSINCCGQFGPLRVTWDKQAAKDKTDQNNIVCGQNCITNCTFYLCCCCQFLSFCLLTRLCKKFSSDFCEILQNYALCVMGRELIKFWGRFYSKRQNSMIIYCIGPVTYFSSTFARMWMIHPPYLRS